MSSSSSSSGEEYNVEKILKSKKRGNKLFYLVKWEGYSDENNSWEPEANLSNCHELLAKFKKSQNSSLNTSTSKKVKSQPKVSEPAQSEIIVTPTKKKRMKSLMSDSDESIVIEPLKKSFTGNSSIASPHKAKSPLLPSKSPRKSQLVKKINISESSDSEREEKKTPKKTNVLRNIMIDGGKKKDSIAKKYTKETLLTMFPGAENGFTKHYTVTNIEGATIKDDEYYLLVKFKELDNPQFILSKVVNKQVPQKVIDFYEKRITFS